MPDRIRYFVLGSLVVQAGDEVRTPTARKQRLLLARLLLDANGVVSTDRLFDALWGDRPPATARKLVQLYVHELRELVGQDMIETEGDGYRLRADPESVDSIRFERLDSAGRKLLADGNPKLAATTLRRALALWRGPAYLDARYDGFAQIEAERLEELRLACLEARIEADVASGPPSDGTVAELQSLLAEHPHREGLRVALMLSLYQSDRQTDALRVYEDGRALLDRQLGLEPGERLRSLQRQILNHDPALRPAADLEGSPSPLPVPTTPLLGRDGDVRSLVELVERPDVRLITIAGAGGIGKSRLALELARECQPRFANGVLLVELAELRDARHVSSVLLDALGAPESVNETTSEALAKFLADREMLIVVDNAEHLQAVGEQLAGLTRAAPRLTVVATSRRVLHVTGEHVHLTSPLEPSAALELFRARAEAAAPDCLQGTSDEAELVAEICRRLDCLPLAIELAAACSAMLTPADLLARLDDRLGLLVDGPRDLPDRQRTLAATLRWSTDLLTETECAGLARLGPFAGGCSLEAVETVAGLELRHLQTLIAHSLVQRAIFDGEPRFTLLESVREHALDLLGSERETAERAHSAYYAGLASGYRRFLESADYNDGGQQGRWLSALDTESANLRAALDWSIATNESRLALELVAGLWRYWHVRGRLSDALETIDQVLALDQVDDPGLVGAALVGAAGLAWDAGRRRVATAYAEQAVSVAPNDLRIALGAENVLGLVATHDGKHDSARHHHERARELAAALGSSDQEMTALINLGDVAYAEGDYDTATIHWLEFLDYWRKRGSSEGIGLGALGLGLASLRRGRNDDADRYFTEARTQFEAIGFREHVGHAILGQAAVATYGNDPERAAQLLGTALAIIDAVGSSPESFDPNLAEEIHAKLRTTLGDERLDRYLTSTKREV